MALNHEVAQLNGGDQGWRGPAAAAWQRDAAAVEALAQVVAWTADITDDLAVELATIEQTLEEAAQVAAGHGVSIGDDWQPLISDDLQTSEQYGTRTYRLAYDQSMADARQASERAAVRLSDLYAVFTGGREAVVRQVVGGPAGSIEGLTAADVVQVGLGDQATAPADADAGQLWDSVL